MTKKPCFNCAEPTGTVVNRVHPPLLPKRVCTKPECWQAWWKLTEASPPKKKGRA